jgi:predicted DNA binding CopG/RHH family protein
MLRFMQQQGFDSTPGAAPAVFSAASFAGLLASLTAPKPAGAPPSRGPSSNFDGLEDDVATLSYERALHTHARYKPSAAEPADTREQAPLAENANSAAAAVPQSGRERISKRASVTVRMSHAECAQLQQRAAEAGMTVSAYLRSCTFEVELLRAQVKQALAQLKSTQTLQEPRKRFRWLRLSHRAAAQS